MEIKDYDWITIIPFDEDILFIEYKEDLVVDIEIAKSLVSSRIDFSGSKNYYVLMDIKGVKQVTNEAKQYLQNADTGLQKIAGGAFLVNSPLSMMLADIFTRPVTQFPVKIFTDMETAVLWLRSLRDNEIKF